MALQGLGEFIASFQKTLLPTEHLARGASPCWPWAVIRGGVIHGEVSTPMPHPLCCGWLLVEDGLVCLQGILSSQCGGNSVERMSRACVCVCMHVHAYSHQGLGVHTLAGSQWFLTFMLSSDPGNATSTLNLGRSALHPLLRNVRREIESRQRRLLGRVLW